MPALFPDFNFILTFVGYTHRQEVVPCITEN